MQDFSRTSAETACATVVTELSYRAGSKMKCKTGTLERLADGSPLLTAELGRAEYDSPSVRRGGALARNCLGIPPSGPVSSARNRVKSDDAKQ